MWPAISQQHPRGGFTLIELTVVIALIAILTAMIIPEMRGTYEDALLRATGRELVNAFELASSRAISLNQAHRVQLDVKTGKYLVARKIRISGRDEYSPLADVAGGEGSLDPRIAVEINQSDTVAAAGENVATVTPGENKLSAAPETISFYPDGTADAVEIQLRDRAGFRLVLELNPITSRIQMLEPARE